MMCVASQVRDVLVFMSYYSLVLVIVAWRVGVCDMHGTYLYTFVAKMIKSK